MPVPFKEFPSTNPVQYAIGGNSKEGIKCAVVKTVNDKKNIADFENMVNGMKTPSNTISNIKKEKYQYYNAIYVEVLDKTECSYMKFIEAANDRFLIMIIFSPQNKKMADQFADRRPFARSRVPR